MTKQNKDRGIILSDYRSLKKGRNKKHQREKKGATNTEALQTSTMLRINGESKYV